MAKIARAMKAALAIRTKGVHQFWRWVYYHQI
jgi:hypothetical protein